MSPYSITSNSTLSLPRILCLHGGGTNAAIFRAQCRALISHLSSFRLIFAEAPFSSKAGPDVLSVYSTWGPFKRWLRWRPEHPELSSEEIVRAIDESLDAAMREDDERGGRGEWVALLGFSQGAKVAASLLYRQQVFSRKYGEGGIKGPLWKFGILFAGRAPLVDFTSFDQYEDGRQVMEPTMRSGLPNASESTDVPPYSTPIFFNHGHVLSIPTIHVHGLRDPGLDLHQQLYWEFCTQESRWLVEWEGEHRVPLKRGDIERVVGIVKEVAGELGLNT